MVRRGGERRAGAAMGVAAYRRLLYGGVIVIFGVMGQAVARGWLARDLTGDNTGLGGVMLVFGASMLVATPLGGVAADRHPKRTVLVWSIAALTVSSLAIGLAVVGGAIAYWMLLVAGGVQAVAFAYFVPARIALISELVPPTAVPNAVVVTQMAQEAMRVLAPALAGLLLGVSWFGVGGVFLSAGALGVVAAGFVRSLPVSPSVAARTGSPFREITGAIAYMRATPGLTMIGLVTVGVVMVGFPYFTFLPTLADERFAVGATGFGVMSGAAGVGAVVAGMVDAAGRASRRPWTKIVVSAAVFGGALVALGVAGSFAVALVALVAVGAGGLVFQTSTQSLMLRLSAFEYHGRLQSMVILGFSGFGLAALPLGLLADATSLRTVLSGMGVTVLAITLAFAAVRHRRRRVLLATEIG